MNHTKNHNKNTLALSLAALIAGGGALPQPVLATTYMDFALQGYFTMLDSGGAALANTSINAKTANQYETPVSGTLSFNVDTGALSASLAPFDWGNNQSGLPFQTGGISLEPIGNGAGGEGSLILANMLFDWNGVTGMPVSMVFDAAGFIGWLPGLQADQSQIGATLSGVGATPAIDGTYVGAVGPADDITRLNGGYLEHGPSPIATTDWNTTPLCDTGGTYGACLGTAPAGGLPLVADTAANGSRYDLNTPELYDLLNGGIGIPGSPVLDGSFTNFSLNFDFTTLTYTGITVIDDWCPPDCGGEVPVPAAVWLLSSGLVGLIGMLRRRR
jgi:hypothetical protein